MSPVSRCNTIITQKAIREYKVNMFISFHPSAYYFFGSLLFVSFIDVGFKIEVPLFPPDCLQEYQRCIRMRTSDDINESIEPFANLFRIRVGKSIEDERVGVTIGQITSEFFLHTPLATES